ncbi:cytidine deaminase [Lacihabitans sp. LS3-19]|uniref:cytidine deaminase n=1 Tax=Lacihabitans sp. LS3-19 TaxID=2487335 RepID=UPI0020CCEE87|nr:cytidine deaminase [Lacihabitans sp. LS3-19]MCP9767513.1 cytidine deaminase [Lacihabitans sp. LS3-19]
MTKRTLQIDFLEIEKLEDLAAGDIVLVEKAIEIAKKSYSPYSNFPVGAAVLMETGEVFAGNNQENIAYPSGTCAERTVLNYVHANFPDKKIKTIAITALNATAAEPVSPCGFCRQVIVEMEMNQKSPIKVILHKLGAQSFVFESAQTILPFAFNDLVLKNK